LIAILFDGMRCRIGFHFTLTPTLSLKGEGDFNYFLSPAGERIEVRGHYVVIFML